MSLASKQKTCAVCGKPITPSTDLKLEMLTDDITRFVLVCPSESIYRRKSRITVSDLERVFDLPTDLVN